MEKKSKLTPMKTLRTQRRNYSSSNSREAEIKMQTCVGAVVQLSLFGADSQKLSRMQGGSFQSLLDTAAWRTEQEVKSNDDLTCTTTATGSHLLEFT